jgi:hypothetical protein
MPELEDLAPQDLASHVMGSISIDGAEGIPNLNSVSLPKACDKASSALRANLLCVLKFCVLLGPICRPHC